MELRYFVVSDNPYPIGPAQVYDRINTTHSRIYSHEDCQALAEWLNDRDSGYFLSSIKIRDILSP
jgi:hypothetical protein